MIVNDSSKFEGSRIHYREVDWNESLLYFINRNLTCSSLKSGEPKPTNDSYIKRISGKCECSKTTFEPYFLVPKLQWFKRDFICMEAGIIWNNTAVAARAFKDATRPRRSRLTHRTRRL